VRAGERLIIRKVVNSLTAPETDQPVSEVEDTLPPTGLGEQSSDGITPTDDQVLEPLIPEVMPDVMPGEDSAEEDLPVIEPTIPTVVDTFDNSGTLLGADSDDEEINHLNLPGSEGEDLPDFVPNPTLEEQEPTQQPEVVQQEPEEPQ
jgi:hypothetical protein